MLIYCSVVVHGLHKDLLQFHEHLLQVSMQVSLPTRCCRLWTFDCCLSLLSRPFFYRPNSVRPVIWLNQKLAFWEFNVFFSKVVTSINNQQKKLMILHLKTNILHWFMIHSSAIQWTFKRTTGLLEWAVCWISDWLQQILFRVFDCIEHGWIENYGSIGEKYWKRLRDLHSNNIQNSRPSTSR